MKHEFYFESISIILIFKMTIESLIRLPCSSSENEEKTTENEVNDIESKKRGKGKKCHFFASFLIAENSIEKLWTKVGVRKFLSLTKS